ncbi:E3 ubiquitin-protein ligase makorin-1 [Biomphalaria pfeifferi]|uniref:E3 ubiquitin-protein ligase makorin-1 n=1 Tax=Biomphalaria pfeifferi TaxID=112525 RepID=A0AAD8CCE3_BIOPF|nr:E3 ubiquitin-protein ligase makorin-1 [Biomphalaria pfeifferi]
MKTLRKLDELSCKQLKEELRARELRIFCDKENMRASLRQNLVDEREDAETYLFEGEPDIREVMSAVLNEVNELICTLIKQICTISLLNKTDELFDTVMNKTDDQIATMSTDINNPLLNGDAVDDSVVYDCNSEPCKLGSYDRNSDICCDSAEHRSDHVIVIPACTQTFNKNCANGVASRGEYDHLKTCQKVLTKPTFVLIPVRDALMVVLQMDLCT